MKRGRIILIAAAAVAVLVAIGVSHVIQDPVRRCASALVAAEQQDGNRGDQAGIRSSACQSLDNTDYLTAHHQAEQRLGETIP